MRRAPLVAPAVAAIVAMSVAHHAAWLTPGLWAAVAATGALLGGAALLARGARSGLVVAGLLLFVAGAGGLRMRSADPRFDPHHWSHLCHGNTLFDLQLADTPQPRARSCRAKATVLAVDGRPCRGSLTLLLRPDSTAATLRLGDRLLLHAHADTVRHSLYTTSDHYLLLRHAQPTLRTRAEGLRLRLLRRARSGPLEPCHAGVAEAMTLGWRGDLEPGVQAAYRDSGLMHLLCVSGLHVGLMAALAGGLMFWAGRERRGRVARGVVQLAAVWGLAVLSGLAPATVRAALMFGLFVVADVLHRRTSRLNLLAAIALAMLLASPMLLFDPGWQLSFAAVTGILVAQPVARAFRSRLMQGAVVSTAATVATLPVVVGSFHRLPLYFLVANVLVVPLGGLLLVLSLAYVALPCGATAWPLAAVLQPAGRLAGWVAGLPGAVVEGLYPSPWALVAIAACSTALLVAGRRVTRGEL